MILGSWFRILARNFQTIALTQAIPPLGHEHIHTFLTAFELPRSIIQGPFGPTQPISTIQGDELEVSKSQKIFWPVVGSN